MKSLVNAYFIFCRAAGSVFQLITALSLSGALLTSAVHAAEIDSVLMEAMRIADVQKVNEALAKGASANAYANMIEQSYITPLMYAALSSGVNAVEIARILIGKGADVNAKDLLGWTPLTYASFYGRYELAALFLEKGADPNARSNVGWTPLMYAARSGHAEIGRLLIAKGAVADLVSKDGKTALSIAASNERTSFVEFLNKGGIK